MSITTIATCAVFAGGILAVTGHQVWEQVLLHKAILDVDNDGIIQEEECICGVGDADSDMFDLPPFERDDIDYSTLQRHEAIARSLAAMASAMNGDIDPQLEVDVLSDMLYQDPRSIMASWLFYTPDSYGTAFNRTYDMTKGAKLVSDIDCARTGTCDYRHERAQENLTVRFVEQLGRNATFHHPYIYAKECCAAVSYGDYVGKSEWAWMWDDFSAENMFRFWTTPLRDYLYGNTTWLDAGRWSDPRVDPLAGLVVSFGVPFVTKVPLSGSVDPFIFSDTRRTHSGFMKSFEGLYVLGVAGIDVRLDQVTLRCPDGSHSTYPTCSLCSLGTYRTAAEPGLDCLKCEPGSYTNQNGSSACTLCLRGYSQKLAGQSLCDPCQPGTAQNERGMARCLQCSTGSAMSDLNASECRRCPIGFYAPERGTTACVTCPNQMITGGLGSVSLDECMCAESTFLGATSKQCERCPLGMYCALGSLDPSLGDVAHTPSLLPGYYSSVQEPLSVYSCNDHVSCPGGLPGTCGGEHIELACQRCHGGRYMSPDGICRHCDSEGIGPFVALFVVGLTSAAVSHVAVNFPLLKTKRTSMTGVFLAGLVVTTMLSFNIYANLNTVWVSPMSDLFSILKILGFDLKILKFSCIAGTSKLMPRYAFKLAAIPGTFLVVCLASFLLQFTKWTRDYAFFTVTDLINSGGLLFSVFFIAVSLASLEGFMCADNPNGTYSLIGDRSVVCWGSTDHSNLVATSTMAILVYPVNFLVVTGYCTWRYYALADRFGTKFTFCMRFLINRWNPDQYYFGIIFTLRNFALTVVPLTQPNNYDIQVTLLQLIFLCWLLVQLSLTPWRFDILNKFDAITSAMQIVVLNCFSLMGGKVTSASLSKYGKGWVAFGAFVFVVVLTFGAAAISFAQKFRKMKEYGLFLSHHKGADALYARQVKLMLATVTTRQVFLDVDNLAGLDELVFLVRSCVDNLVVMLSPETLNRFWCAVEIICATKNRMPIILTNTHPVVNLLSAEFLERVPHMWGPAETTDFNKVGIMASDDTVFAYRFIATLPIIRMMMDSSENEQFEAIANVISVAKGCRTERRAYTIESHQVSYILYNTNCFVQACCARILCMLMKANRWNCFILSEESTRGEHLSSVMLVLVSHGFVRDPVGLGHVCHLNQQGVPYTTIISQQDFEGSKPPKDYLKHVLDGSAFNEGQLTILERVAPGVTPSSIVEVVVALYASLAARFDPQDSEHMLYVELSTILKRAEQRLAKFTKTISGYPGHVDWKRWCSSSTRTSSASGGSNGSSKRDSPSKILESQNQIQLSKPSVAGSSLPNLFPQTNVNRMIEEGDDGVVRGFYFV